MQTPDYFTQLIKKLGRDNYFHTTDAWKVKSILENGIYDSPEFTRNTNLPRNCTLTNGLSRYVINEQYEIIQWGTSDYNRFPLDVTFVVDGKDLIELGLETNFTDDTHLISLVKYPNIRIHPIAGILYFLQIQKSKSATLQEVVDADLTYGTNEISRDSTVAYPRGKGIFTTQEELEKIEGKVGEKCLKDFNWFVERKKCIERCLAGVDTNVNALEFVINQFRNHEIPLYTNRGEMMV